MSHWTIAQAIVLTYHGLVSCFAFKKSKVLIDMPDDDGRTARLRQETFCNNGGNKTCFDNLKLQ